MPGCRAPHRRPRPACRHRGCRGAAAEAGGAGRGARAGRARGPDRGVAARDARHRTRSSPAARQPAAADHPHPPQARHRPGRRPLHRLPRQQHLRPGPSAAVDWDEFRILAGRGHAGRDRGPLRAALALVRGQPPLAGLYYWWLEPAFTETVRAAVAGTAALLAGLELAAGEPAAARRCRPGGAGRRRGRRAAVAAADARRGRRQQHGRRPRRLARLPGRGRRHRARRTAPPGHGRPVPGPGRALPGSRRPRRPQDVPPGRRGAQSRPGAPRVPGTGSGR